MRFGLFAIVFLLMGQNAIAQNQCLDALQRLDALQLVSKFGQIVFRCDPSGAWSVSIGNQGSASPSQVSSTHLSPSPGLQPVTGLQTYKRALCIAGSDAQTDFVDNNMREGLRQFVAGQTWENVQDAAPELDDPLRRKLAKAVQFFPECNIQNGQIRNAYELGVYSREVNSAAAGITSVENILSLAAKTLNSQGARLGRPAIESLRAELERRNRLDKVDAKRDQLDDKLWPVIVACAASEGIPELPGPRAGRPSSPC
jgi:hypothetical protein